MLGKIGDAIIFILNIIMCWTQCMTWLYTVKEVIFDNELFGSFATQKVMKEMITKHARRIFFCMQKLQKYQQGFLPCWTSIQNCAAELHQLGQDLITSEKVSSDLGEMYQFHHENLTRHILRTLQLDEIAQRESIELCITLDGPELTKFLCHLSFGVKITDLHAIEPRDGMTFVYTEEGV